MICMCSSISERTRLDKSQMMDESAVLPRYLCTRNEHFIITAGPWLSKILNDIEWWSLRFSLFSNATIIISLCVWHRRLISVAWTKIIIIDNIKLARLYGNIQRIFFDLFIGLMHCIPSCSMISVYLRAVRSLRLNKCFIIFYILH